MADNLGIGAMGLNPLSGMLDSMEMIKRAWSSFQLPSGIAPTMDIDELDRRIKDMKAVEQWLRLNLQMLQGTIQGMELQRSTIAAFQSFGHTAPPTAGASAQPATGRREDPPAPEAPMSAQASSETAGAFGAAAQELGNAAAAAMNPTAWWNLLTSQFEQVATAAMQGAQSAAETDAKKPRERSSVTRAPAAKKSSSTTGSRSRKTPSKA